MMMLVVSRTAQDRVNETLPSVYTLWVVSDTGGVGLAIADRCEPFTSDLTGETE